MVADNLEKEISSSEAKAIIQKAKDDIDLLLKSTDEEINKRVEAAKEVGLKKGYEKVEELKGKLNKFQKVILSEVDEGIIHAALDAARQVLEIEIINSAEATLLIVEAALSDIPESTQVWLRVNPADAPLLLKNKAKIIEVLERANEVNIREDRQVERGGVLIQTQSGVIDAQISTQLDEMARILGV